MANPRVRGRGRTHLLIPFVENSLEFFMNLGNFTRFPQEFDQIFREIVRN